MSIRYAINMAKSFKSGITKDRLNELSTEQWNQIDSSLEELRDSAHDALMALREVRGAK